MDYLKHYLYDRRRTLAALPLLGGTAALLCFLYGLPAGPLCYTALVCLMLWLCVFVLPDFVRYVRRTRDLDALKQNLLSVLEFPEMGGTYPETLLAQSGRLLCQQVQELQTRYVSREADQLEYYTLWVHQVKTPLSAMRLILQSSPSEASPALLQELFKVERYVEMVLGYLRLDTMSADLRLESCPVREIARQAVKKFAPQFIYRNLMVDMKEFDNRVVTDRKWLLFVIEQLLSNAAKYTESGGVTISMTEEDVLVIRDTGVGIYPEDLPRVFERGFTGRNGRSGMAEHAGSASTGLGLYLCKRVLDKLQNRIELQSEPGCGTEVRLFLHRPRLQDF